MYKFSQTSQHYSDIRASLTIPHVYNQIPLQSFSLSLFCYLQIDVISTSYRLYRYTLHVIKHLMLKWNQSASFSLCMHVFSSAIPSHFHVWNLTLATIVAHTLHRKAWLWPEDESFITQIILSRHLTCLNENEACRDFYS